MNTDSIFLFDTETVGLPPVNFVYDIAWVITDRHGNIKKRRNFLIEEIITDGKKMMGAFFARKIFSWYIPAIDKTELCLTPIAYVLKAMREDLTECKTVAAYNVGFDLSAMSSTIETLGHDVCDLFVDKKILCLWNFSCEALLASKNYHKVARENGWRSRAGNFKTSAEATFRYITNKLRFVEKHTALDDCMIENEILKACFARKKKIPYGKFNNAPWRKAQPKEQLDAMKQVRRMMQYELFVDNGLFDRG